MKRFLNRIARSIITAADAIARLTDDQSSDAPTPRAGSVNGIRDEQSCKDKESLPTETSTQPQQDFIRSEPPISTSFPDTLRDEGFADQSQPIAQPDDSAAEPEVSPEEDWISFADPTDLFESDIYLDTKCTTGPGLNEIDAEENPLQSNDGLNVANALPNPELQLPAHAPAASLVGENHQVASAGETSAGNQYSGFDISLSDLEEKFESTWQEESRPPYVSTVQPESEPPGPELYEEAVEGIERGQASHEFDLTFTNLEVRQQSTWHDSPNDVPAEKSTASPTNIESGVKEDHKSKLDSQATSFSQQASTQSPRIQGAANLHEATDDYWVFRRIKLCPDGLEELQLRQSGALVWDLRWDPQDYIWALDGVGYFDNIWNVEGFFESMISEAEDRCYEDLYWSEYQDE
jgi:hypothetical protein